MKNVIVTGASKGIGYATAREFAQNGNKVLAIARNKEGLGKLKREHPENILSLEADLSEGINTDDVRSILTDVDIVIHNAGYLINKPFQKISRAELQKSYQVNVLAPFLLTQQLMPLLNKGAHIIMIGSVGGVTGTQKFAGLSAYSSSKAALSCLAEVLQAEFADEDICFNSLALGAVQTEMLESAFPGYRALVHPEAMAKYIFDFALNAPSVLRGQTIIVSRSNP